MSLHESNQPIDLRNVSIEIKINGVSIEVDEYTRSIVEAYKSTLPEENKIIEPSPDEKQIKYNKQDIKGYTFITLLMNVVNMQFTFLFGMYNETDILIKTWLLATTIINLLSYVVLLFYTINYVYGNTDKINKIYSCCVVQHFMTVIWLFDIGLFGVVITSMAFHKDDPYALMMIFVLVFSSMAQLTPAMVCSLIQITLNIEARILANNINSELV
jgi:hypothetical protein